MKVTHFKRAIDVGGSLALIILTAPLWLFIALIVRITLGSPVLFRQMRPGLGERLFTIWKFRTMQDACDQNGKLLSDGLRATRFGRLLRRTSLDELPTLINVLRGEMSLVGPRPLLPEYLERYTERQRLRHRVRPGITGWAQVNGRQHLSFSRRLDLDVWYVENWDLWLDLRILVRTIPVVLVGTGVETGQDVSSVDDAGLTGHTTQQKGG